MTPRYHRAADALAADLGEGRLALMGVAQGRYYALNPVARAIWDFLDHPRSPEQIRAHIRGSFEVDAATCERDADHFLKELLDEGLIERA